MPLIWTKPKRHLIRRTGPPVMSACGVEDPQLSTNDPAEVDCAGCSRTVFMADAEMLKQLKEKNRKRKRFPTGNQKRSNQ